MTAVPPNDVVTGAQRDQMYGWGRISHEAEIVKHCMVLGGVLLSPAAPQARPDEFAHAPKVRRSPDSLARRP